MDVAVRSSTESHVARDLTRFAQKSSLWRGEPLHRSLDFRRGEREGGDSQLTREDRTGRIGASLTLKSGRSPLRMPHPSPSMGGRVEVRVSPGLVRSRHAGWHSQNALAKLFNGEHDVAPGVRRLRGAGLTGWKSAATVINVYQQPDTETMRAALDARRAIAGV